MRMEKIKQMTTMHNIRSYFTRTTLALGGLLLVLASCKRDDYYIDGGRANPVFEGTVMEYLDSKPRDFDTIAQIVRLAGLEETFHQDEFTFFAPHDEDIKDLIGQVGRGGVNTRLYNLGRDTIAELADVDSVIWRKYVERYMFRGRNKLMDYPQVDFDLLTTYSGQNYYSINNSVSNIGVVYHDAVTADARLRYMGYRQLHISYIPDLAQPQQGWVTIPVASSDIQPSNGIVHALDFTKGGFGFVQREVEDDILESKR